MAEQVEDDGAKRLESWNEVGLAERRLVVGDLNCLSIPLAMIVGACKEIINI